MGIVLVLGVAVAIVAFVATRAGAAKPPAPGPAPGQGPAPGPAVDHCVNVKAALARVLSDPNVTAAELEAALKLSARNAEQCGLAETQKALSDRLLKLRGVAPAPKPIAGPTSAVQPTIRRGSKGAAVLDAQLLLAAAGFYPGSYDGIYGPKTASATQSFQKSRGLAVDGIIGPKTWPVLLGTMSPDELLARRAALAKANAADLTS